MSIELKKTTRIALPTGVLDVALQDRRAYTACMDGIYAVDLSERSEPAERPKPRLIGRHGSYVSSVAVRPENSTLISAGFDGMLEFRDLPSIDGPTVDAPNSDAPNSDPTSVDSTRDRQAIEPRHRERIHAFWSWDMSLSPNQKVIASVTGQYLAGSEEYEPAAGAEPTVKLLSGDTGQLLHALEMLPSVQCVAFDATSQFVAAANLMGDIAVWSVGSGERLAQWRTKEFTSWGIIKSHCYIGGIFAIAFAPDSESLLVAGMGDMRDPMAGNGKQLWHRYAWRQSPSKPVQTIDLSEAGEGLMEVLRWHPSGKYFVMAGRLRGGNWNLGIFDQASGRLVGQAKTGMRITSAQFNSEGNLLTVAGMQGQPKPKEGRFPDFGYIEQYEFNEG